jgi:hypothetical protein
MARRKRFTPEQIITRLKEAEIYLGQGKTVKEMLEISEQTYYIMAGEKTNSAYAPGPGPRSLHFFGADMVHLPVDEDDIQVAAIGKFKDVPF